VVQVTSATGIIGAAPVVRIRGVASISSGTQPLYIVDGMPIYSGDWRVCKCKWSWRH
jgi:hypothetical protein